MLIRERQIEDVLVGSPNLVKSMFGLSSSPHLVGRQIIVPSGRLDMLFSYKNDYLLIELKVANFQKKFIDQVLDYKTDLLSFQQQGKLSQGNIIPFLLMPANANNHRSEIEARNVNLQEYNPEEVLKYFFNKNLKPITAFSELKPVDVGIWNIHLIYKFIYHVVECNSISALRTIVGGSPKTLYNKIRFASELGLINWSKNGDYIGLTSDGMKYVQEKDIYYDTLSEGQTKLLKQKVMESPYESNIILGIASMVECVFTLSKSCYPVSTQQLESFFTIYSGKVLDWQTDRAKYYGTKMYSNYAVDLGLLAKNENDIYLTPEGVNFVVQMQLHKSLKLMNAINNKDYDTQLLC